MCKECDLHFTLSVAPKTVTSGWRLDFFLHLNFILDVYYCAWAMEHLISSALNIAPTKGNMEQRHVRNGLVDERLGTSTPVIFLEDRILNTL